MKGSVSAVLAIMVFISFFAFLIIGIQVTNPEISGIFSTIDLALFIAGFAGTAIACTFLSGATCVVSAGAFALLPSVATNNPILFALIILPINITLGYIISRLATGGG